MDTVFSFNSEVTTIKMLQYCYLRMWACNKQSTVVESTVNPVLVLISLPFIRTTTSSSNSKRLDEVTQRILRRFKVVLRGTAAKMGGQEGTTLLCQSWSWASERMILVRSQRKCKGAKEKEEVVEEEEGTAPRMIRGRHSLPENCQSWCRGHMIPATKTVRSLNVGCLKRWLQ